ncbi:MAG: hypothetical protein IJ583_12680 [Firmicutes bacterium]|nr:hypothetical protein [Bacillota bacterium]
MSFLDIFSKKKSIEQLYDELKAEQERGNLIEVANIYYELGEAYLKKNKERSLLYMNRFKTLTENQEHILNKIPKKKIDKAIEIIGKIRSEKPYIVTIRDKVKDLGKDMTGKQKIKWNLLTIARYNILFNRLCTNTGFELLEKFGDILFILMKGYDASIEEVKKLNKFTKEFASLIKSVELADTENVLHLENGEDMQAYDLTGNDILKNMYNTLFDLSKIFGAEKISDEMKTDFVPDAMICDYYVRTRECPLEENKEIKEEEERIFADHKFIMADPSEESFRERMTEYGRLMLLK